LQHSLYGARLDAEGAADSQLTLQDTLTSFAAPGVKSTRDGIPVAQILNDRPDVFRAFYDGFYGGGYDRDPAPWVARVGGPTAEDYANYWYEQHGLWEGYGQGASGFAGAPLEPGDVVLPPGIHETGRTVAEGYLISHILSERPDVFRAFFTEFYGPNNDRNSSAWVERVGGDTVEDYANFWWETYGRASGWTPSQTSGGPGAAPIDDGGGEPTPGVAAPLVIEYTEDGVILRPAEPDDIIEDGVVVGRQPSAQTDDTLAGGDPRQVSTPDHPDPWEGLARPLVIELTPDGGLELRPAAPGEIVQEGVVVGNTLFGTELFG
jgi:hypothetical protein